MGLFTVEPARIEFTPSPTQNSRIRHLLYSLLMLLLLFLQVTIIPFLTIANSVPDLPLILCVMITLREGQLTGTLYGFTAGLIYDIAALQILGVGALSYMMAAFFAGFFYAENLINRNLTRPRFFWIVLLATIIRFSLSTIFTVIPSHWEFSLRLITSPIGNILYTTFAALFPWLILTKR